MYILGVGIKETRLSLDLTGLRIQFHILGIYNIYFIEYGLSMTMFENLVL